MNRPISVTNFRIFGEMVKAWARDPASRPAGATPAEVLADFKAQIKAKEQEEQTTIATVDDSVTELEMIQMAPHRLIIKLADPALIQDSEDHLKTGAGGYPLPSFYGAIGAPEAQPTATVDQKLAFHAKRIGDYTVGNCV